MGWKDQEGQGSLGNITKIGDKEGQSRSVEGIFVGTRPGPHGLLYGFIGASGKRFTVPYNFVLGDKLGEGAMGKLVQVEFIGTKALKDGKTLKELAVRVYEGEPTAQMIEDYPTLQDPVDEEPAVVAGSDDEDDDLPF